MTTKEMLNKLETLNKEDQEKAWNYIDKMVNAGAEFQEAVEAAYNRFFN